MLLAGTYIDHRGRADLNTQDCGYSAAFAKLIRYARRHRYPWAHAAASAPSSWSSSSSIVLLIFGAKRLPALGRQLGSGMREFKESITGKDKTTTTTRRRAELGAAAKTAPPTPHAARPRSADPRPEPRSSRR